MVTIVDLSLPGSSFALGDLLTENPEMYIEIERLVPLDGRLLPFFWVSNGSTDHIESALLSQSVVESVNRLTAVDDSHLYQVTWTPDVNGLVDALLETDSVILEGTGVGGQWELRLRFPDQEQLKRFNELCSAKDIPFDVNGIYNPHVPAIEDQLTAAQWKTLALAYEVGYFDVPRNATLTDIAEQLGVSKQAVSQRLRRGTGTVIGMFMHES